jgi:hypothetical protein
MTDREVMKMAFDAFEDLKKSVTRDGTVPENWDAYYEKEYYALEALRQALAQKQTKCPRCGEVNPAEIHTCSPQVAQEQEPVAWMVLTQDDKKLMLWGQEKPPIFDAPVKLIPLYTAPPKQWVGLTDDEIEHLRNDQPWWMVRDIEAKLKEKNNGST